MKITFLFPKSSEIYDKLYEEIDLLEDLIYFPETNLSPMQQVNWVEQFSIDKKEDFDIIVATYSPYIAEAFNTYFPKADMVYKVDNIECSQEKYYFEFAEPMRKMIMQKL